MMRGRRFLGQLVLVLAVTAGAFVGAKLGLLGTREVGASHNFSDVPDSAFYHAFVQFLVDNGITSGCGNGQFCGESPVTRGQMAVFLQRLAALTCLRREGNDVIFEGCNVHVRSGAGATGAAVNGLGNLIVGYNEAQPADIRTGSHNLVVGPFHTYSSHGGLVAGLDNAITGPNTTVSSGSSTAAASHRGQHGQRQRCQHHRRSVQPGQRDHVEHQRRLEQQRQRPSCHRQRRCRPLLDGNGRLESRYPLRELLKGFAVRARA